MRVQTNSGAVDTLILHLEGVAKEEVKLKPINFPVLLSLWRLQDLRAFSEQLTKMRAR